MEEQSMFRFSRLFMVLVLIGIVIAAGSLVYRAGMDQGYQLGYYTAPRSEVSPAPAPAPAPAPYYAPYYYGPRFGPLGYGGFNPFGWLIGIGFFILGLFLIGSLVRLFFFHRYGRNGSWGWGMGRHGHGFWGSEPGTEGDKGEKGRKEWRGPWSGDVPPFFKEWHDRAHQQAEQAPQNPPEPPQES